MEESRHSSKGTFIGSSLMLEQTTHSPSLSGQQEQPSQNLLTDCLETSSTASSKEVASTVVIRLIGTWTINVNALFMIFFSQTLLLQYWRVEVPIVLLALRQDLQQGLS